MVSRHTKRVRVSGSKFEFFLLGLGLGYIRTCYVTLVYVHVPIVILKNKPTQLTDRIRSDLCDILNNFFESLQKCISRLLNVSY